MVVIVLTVIAVGLVYRRYSKRRAQKRAAKLASLHRAMSSRVNATDETLSGSDEVMVIETRRVVERESMPPPYSMPTPPPNDSDSDPSEDLPHFTIPELEYSRTYACIARDKPPSYSSTIRRVQNP